MSRAKKQAYADRLVSLLEEYQRILFVTCDNIGSHHMAKIRKSLRGKAVLIMGKNTMMRRAIRMQLKAHPEWEVILPALVGNVGLVFTNEDLSSVKSLVLATRVPAAAKAGIIAPNSVTIPKGQTQMPPTKTSFLQQLGIASKINRGTIEILSDVQLIQEGDKVGASEAQLLTELDIRPFSYGLVIKKAFNDGEMIPSEVLDITDADILSAFGSGVTQVAKLSLGLSFATLAALPHVFANAYKNVLAVAIAGEYSFPQADKIKDMIANPDAYASAAPAAGAAEAAPVEEEEEEEEESEDMGFDLFG